MWRFSSIWCFTNFDYPSCCVFVIVKVNRDWPFSIRVGMYWLYLIFYWCCFVSPGCIVSVLPGVSLVFLSSWVLNFWSTRVVMFLFFLVLRVPGSDVCLGSTLFCTGVVLSTWILMFLFFLVLRVPGSDVLDQLYFSLMGLCLSGLWCFSSSWCLTGVLSTW
jgi:hypothetical protein